MKIIGVIGGIGPESTIEYYRHLVEFHREFAGTGYPPVVISSIDLDRMIELFEGNRLAEVTRYLTDELARLARAGAEVALISANTPHVVFDDVQRTSPIPLVSIVQATLEEAKARGFARLGLFGTRFTMMGGFYQPVFERGGVSLAVPDAAERDIIHEKYLGELVRGVFLPATHDRLVAIARRLRDEEGIEGLILGGTELPLILRDERTVGLPLLDTARIHARSIVVRARGGAL